MKKATLLPLVALLAAVSLAVAGGGHHYPDGVENYFSGIAPPPGFHVVNYTLYYAADTYRDDDGNTVDGMQVNVFGEVVRFVWISDRKVWGGNYGQHLFLIWMNQNLRPGSRSFSKSGMADVIWSPFLVTWHGQKVHCAISLADIYLPVGSYDHEDPVNPGKNFWTIEPVFAVTWFPGGKWNVSAKFMYDINGTNDEYAYWATGRDHDLKPGQEFHVDYAVGYSFNQKWTVGLNGYLYYQVTDDEMDGRDLADQKSRYWAAGPGVFYNAGRLKMSLTSAFEFGARNWFEGSSVLFKLYYSF